MSDPGEGEDGRRFRRTLITPEITSCGGERKKGKGRGYARKSSLFLFFRREGKKVKKDEPFGVFESVRGKEKERGGKENDDMFSIPDLINAIGMRGIIYTIEFERGEKKQRGTP